jgi:hypothetical protein
MDMLGITELSLSHTDRDWRSLVVLPTRHQRRALVMAIFSLLLIEEKWKRRGTVLHVDIGMRRESGETDVVIVLSISSAELIM